tara:strand:+ start:319 stop:525 length:207 start_codon:yes stop_codon:yes gene_type:complete
VVDLARKSTPTTIAQALTCVRKVRQGKACSMSELKASLLLLDDARKTALGTIRMLKDRIKFMLPFTNR